MSCDLKCRFPIKNYGWRALISVPTLYSCAGFPLLVTLSVTRAHSNTTKNCTQFDPIPPRLVLILWFSFYLIPIFQFHSISCSICSTLSHSPVPFPASHYLILLFHSLLHTISFSCSIPCFTLSHSPVPFPASHYLILLFHSLLHTISFSCSIPCFTLSHSPVPFPASHYLILILLFHSLLHTISFSCSIPCFTLSHSPVPFPASHYLILLFHSLLHTISFSCSIPCFTLSHSPVPFPASHYLILILWCLHSLIPGHHHAERVRGRCECARCSCEALPPPDMWYHSMETK